MNILIFNGVASFDENRWAEWLFGHSLVVLTSPRAIAGVPAERVRGEEKKYAEVVYVDDYFNSPMVEKHAFSLHRKYRFEKIVASAEGDRIRAARLRDLWGIEGQGLSSAWAFKDKLGMKSYLKKAGVSSARFERISSAAELILFADRIGYPFVVKPRLLSGSIGVAVIRSEEELQTYLCEHMPLNEDTDPLLIAEEFIEHEKVYRVNGLVEEGEVTVAWPSHWSHMLGYRHGKTTRSLMLDESHPKFNDLLEICKEGLKALPTPKDTIFLVEVFERMNGTLLFNEVAGAIGDFRSRELLREAFGFDFCERIAKRQCGIWVPSQSLPRPSSFLGVAALPPCQGTLIAIPETCPFASVIGYKATAKPRQNLSAAKRTSDIIASCLVRGSNAAGLAGELEAVTSWLESQTTYAAGV